jgi:mannose/fructose/N-acetylgalactosamine-specific phosphotransferase system component IIB
LIHGQVVVGWGSRLGLDYVAVIDDELATSEWEQDLYRAGLPHSIEARFLDVEDGAERLPEWNVVGERGFVLTRDLGTMVRLAERDALDGLEVNLGGLHDAPGRRRVLPYLFLSEQDREALAALRRVGVRVSAQDVPGARKIGLNELLELRPD